MNLVKPFGEYSNVINRWKTLTCGRGDKLTKLNLTNLIKKFKHKNPKHVKIRLVSVLLRDLPGFWPGTLDLE